ncbi:hypothetical protein D1007_42882 [Hordeum vulgare]|nr:hypothetical protein D1007_42882 [Hordeum vulgare]
MDDVPCLRLSLATLAASSAASHSDCSMPSRSASALILQSEWSSGLSQDLVWCTFSNLSWLTVLHQEENHASTHPQPLPSRDSCRKKKGNWPPFARIPDAGQPHLLADVPPKSSRRLAYSRSDCPSACRFPATSLYLLRLPPALPSSLSGFEATLLAVYSSEAKNRQGKPVLVHIPDLSVPSLYHTPQSSPSSRSPRRPHPPPIPPPPANVVVGVLSPPLEPQAAVKSTKRAGIIGVAFEAYYAKIAQMPPASKVDACNAVAAWAGQYCRCRFEFDEELEVEEGDSLGSMLPLSTDAENGNGKALEKELAKMHVNRDSNGRNCGKEEEVREARVQLPWELLQPVMRVLGHCLLAPLNPTKVRDAAAEAVEVVYARVCHDLVPQAILAARSLIELDKSARKAAKAATVAASGIMVASSTAGSTASSYMPSSKPNTPSKQRKPDMLLVSK